MGADAGVVIDALLGMADDAVVELVWVDLFGKVPEVKAIGKDGTVLGVDEDKDNEGCVALVEVLAFGSSTLGSGTVWSGLDLAAVVTLACTGGAWSRMSSAVPSALVAVYQLKLNSGSVWFTS